MELDFESKVLHSRIIGVKDVITYEGNTLQDLEEASRNSLDDYLAFCEEQGDKPEKPYSGKFNLRIHPELHKQLALEAANQGKSLNSCVEEILYTRRFCGHADPSPITASL